MPGGNSCLDTCAYTDKIVERFPCRKFPKKTLQPSVNTVRAIEIFRPHKKPWTGNIFLCIQLSQACYRKDCHQIHKRPWNLPREQANPQLVPGAGRISSLTQPQQASENSLLIQTAYIIYNSNVQSTFLIINPLSDNTKLQLLCALAIFVLNANGVGT